MFSTLHQHLRSCSAAAGPVRCPVAGAAGATAPPWFNVLLGAVPQPAGMIPKLHTNQLPIKPTMLIVDHVLLAQEGDIAVQQRVAAGGPVRLGILCHVRARRPQLLL